MDTLTSLKKIASILIFVLGYLMLLAAMSPQFRNGVWDGMDYVRVIMLYLGAWCILGSIRFYINH